MSLFLQREYAEARKTGRFIDLDAVTENDIRQAQVLMKREDAEEEAEKQREANKKSKEIMDKLNVEVVILAYCNLADDRRPCFLISILK